MSGDSSGHHSREGEEVLLASEGRNQGCCSPGEHRTAPQQALCSPLQMVAVPDRDALVMGRQHPFGL